MRNGFGLDFTASGRRFHPRDLGNVIVYQAARNAYSLGADFSLAPVTAPGVPVYALLDQGGGELGPETLVNWDFSAGATGWTVTGTDATHIATFDATAGTLRYRSDTVTPNLDIRQSLVLTIGAVYEVTVVCSEWISGAVKTVSFGGVTELAAGVGTKTFRAVATATAFNILRVDINVDLTISSISLRKISGSHAIAPLAAANRPTYAVDAYGLPVIALATDDKLNLAGALGFTRNRGYLWAVVGVDLQAQTASANNIVFNFLTSGGYARFALYATTIAGVTILYARGADGDATAGVTTPFVAGRQVLRVMVDYVNRAAYIYRNGTLVASTTNLAITAGNTSDTDSVGAAIGDASVCSEFNMGLAVFGNTAISAADLAMVEAWVAREMGL